MHQGKRVCRLMRTALSAVIVLTLFPTAISFAQPVSREHATGSEAPKETIAVSDAGQIRMALSRDGYIGNGFIYGQASLEYPANSSVEHLFMGGLWVGARRGDQTINVSTAHEDAANAVEADEMREFSGDDRPYRVISNLQSGPHDYHPDALAPFQFECAFDDDVVPEEGGHVPLGIEIRLKAMSWSFPAHDDAVVLEYTVVNISGATLYDVYVGLFLDATIGNTLVNDPYGGSTNPWNWYDDLISGWCPGDVPGDPDIWMMGRHDQDGDDGWATSWLGCRLLGTQPSVTADPPASYNAWRFRQVPEEDDFWLDDQQQVQLGKYQIMSNGDFDVGETAEVDFTMATLWMALLATGPFPALAADDSVTVTFALVCGDGEQALLDNARSIADLYGLGYQSGSIAVPSAASGTRLLSPEPNPLNPSTRLAFELGRASHTTLALYGLDGGLVRVLGEGFYPAGHHHVTWDGLDGQGRSAASGMYIVRLFVDDVPVRSGRVMVVR